MKADLDVLLQQRSQMDSLKTMLMGKLKGGGPMSSILQAGPRQQVSYPTTVITGQWQ